MRPPLSEEQQRGLARILFDVHLRRQQEAECEKDEIVADALADAAERRVEPARYSTRDQT